MFPILFTSQKNSLQNGLVLDPIQKNLKSISTRRFPLIRCPPYAHLKTFRGRVHPGKNPLPHPKARHPPGLPGRLQSCVGLFAMWCGVRDIFHKGKSRREVPVLRKLTAREDLPLFYKLSRARLCRDSEAPNSGTKLKEARNSVIKINNNLIQ